jgi:hypothetical protein
VQLQLAITDKTIARKTHDIKNRNHPGNAKDCPVLEKPGKFLLGRDHVKEKEPTRKLQLMSFTAPQMCGEGAALANLGNVKAKRSASIIAVTDVVAFVLSKASFVKYIVTDPYGAKVMQHMKLISKRRKAVMDINVGRSLKALSALPEMYAAELAEQRKTKASIKSQKVQTLDDLREEFAGDNYNERYDLRTAFTTSTWNTGTSLASPRLNTGASSNQSTHYQDDLRGETPQVRLNTAQSMASLRHSLQSRVGTASTAMTRSAFTPMIPLNSMSDVVPPASSYGSRSITSNSYSPPSSPKRLDSNKNPLENEVKQCHELSRNCKFDPVYHIFLYIASYGDSQ